jgi:hypothetical protein
MLLTSFPPASRNVPSNDSSGATFGLSDSSAILTNLSQPQATLAGWGKFTGSFHVVPASWDDFSRSLGFTFPGFLSYVFGGANARDIFTDVVQIRVRRDYYVLDPENKISAVTAGSPGNATSLLDSNGNAVKCVYQLSDIPRVKKSIFYAVAAGFTFRTNSLTPVGGISLYLETMPTIPAFQGFIANAVSNGWSSTVWDGSSNTIGTVGQLVMEASTLEPYAGQIVARVSMYVLCA